MTHFHDNPLTQRPVACHHVWIGRDDVKDLVALEEGRPVGIEHDTKEIVLDEIWIPKSP